MPDGGDEKKPEPRPAKPSVAARLGFGGKDPKPAPGKISRHMARGNAAHERGKRGEGRKK